MSGGRILSRGFTLLEMLCCIALVGIFFLALTQMEASLRLTGPHYIKDSSTRALMDIHALLLSDIHRATGAEVPEETQLRLLCEGEEILWSSKGDRIERSAGRHHMVWKTGDPLVFALGGPSSGCILMKFTKADWYFLGCRP